MVANAFLKQALVGGSSPTFAPRTRRPVRVGLRLAREALAQSPDCADAYVLLAEATRDAQQARWFYEEGVEAGRRGLGPEPFDEDVGHFTVSMPFGDGSHSRTERSGCTSSVHYFPFRQSTQIFFLSPADLDWMGQYFLRIRPHRTGTLIGTRHATSVFLHWRYRTLQDRSDM